MWFQPGRVSGLLSDEWEPVIFMSFRIKPLGWPALKCLQVVGFQPASNITKGRPAQSLKDDNVEARPNTFWQGYPLSHS